MAGNQRAGSFPIRKRYDWKKNARRLSVLQGTFRVEDKKNWSHVVSKNMSGFFGGFTGFARLLSSRILCVVVYAKVPWLSLHAKYRDRKAKQAAPPFFSRSQHKKRKSRKAGNTKREFTCAIFFFHKWKASYGPMPTKNQLTIRHYKRCTFV